MMKIFVTTSMMTTTTATTKTTAAQVLYFVRNEICISFTVCFAFFPRALKMVGIVIHLGEQFFGGAPDHVVAAGRARARVRGSGLKPNFQGVPSESFVI